MELSGVQLIAIFIVSAIAGMGSVLDEFQTHRPLIACTLVGAILGDMTTGIIIGGHYNRWYFGNDCTWLDECRCSYGT